jgi:hypothetical protein
MSFLSFYDSAYPPANPPANMDGVCGYIGGDTPHVWDLTDWNSQHVRYRLPIFVRSNPSGANASADVGSALTQLRAIKAPKGILIAWDMETASDANYIKAVYKLISTDGYKLIVYGSQDEVFGNQNPDGLYWGADWTSVKGLVPGDAITQWVSFNSYDEDTATATLPYWDLNPPKPKPTDPTYGAPLDLKVIPGKTSMKLSWSAPAPVEGLPPVSEYTLFVYRGTDPSRSNIAPTYPRNVGNVKVYQGGSLSRHTTYTAHVVASGPGFTHVGAYVYASVTFETS